MSIDSKPRSKKRVSESRLLLSEWDSEKNTDLSPDSVTIGSRKKVWWKCEKCQGSYCTQIYNKANGRGCPYCAGKRVLIGYNDLQTVDKQLASEWDNDKNNKSPQEVTKGDSHKYWWKCKKGHNWQDRIPDRLKGYGCPFCSGRKVLSGFNDLQTKYPALALEWNEMRNGDKKPNQFTPGVTTKVWWKCSTCGHEWQATIGSRTNGRNCPMCMQEIQKEKRIVTMLRKGKNSLESCYPYLVAEWHPSKNNGLSPSQVTSHSSQKVWWICKKCGYEWESSILHRAHGRGCPKCNLNSTSFSEQAVYYYIKQCFPNAISRYSGYGFELDVYIPEIHIAIEYDGVFYHNDEHRANNDAMKDELCKKEGIQLIRIREKGLSATPNAINIIRDDKRNSSLEKAIGEVLRITNADTIVTPCIHRDFAAINDGYDESYKESSLSVLYENIAMEWHPIKNGKLLPSQVTCHSGKKVWWICEQGHEYQCTVASRVSGVGCPKCGRKSAANKLQKKRVLPGINDFGTLFPSLAEEWDYSMNDDSPRDYLPHSQKKKTWLCKTCGNKWVTSIQNRTSGRGCPKCAVEKTRLRLAKQVKCVETGIVFRSLSDAAKWAGVSNSLISLCARGKISHAANYHWIYI